MWDCFHSPKPNDKPPTPRTSLLPKPDAAPDGDGDHDPRRRHHHHPPTTTIAMIVTSWARGRRLRYLFLALCSPLILPLLCVAFPFICAVEICFCVCRRRRRKQSKKANDDDFDSDAMRRCEEGDVREIRLLQRYLEDQLLLVLESVYESGELEFDDWDDDGGDGEFFDSCCRN